MSSAIIWNLVLAVPFVLAFIGIPLWMTIRHLDRAPDHTAARRYLTARGTPVVSTARVTSPRLAAGRSAAASER